MRLMRLGGAFFPNVRSSIASPVSRPRRGGGGLDHRFTVSGSACGTPRGYHPI
jgi:hypothetical protein